MPSEKTRDAKSAAAPVMHAGSSSGAGLPTWLAPPAGAPLAATLALPGSKSVTNRALVLAALAQSPSTLHKPLYSRDSTLMINALRSLGVGVDQQPVEAGAGADFGAEGFAQPEPQADLLAAGA